MLTSRSGSAGHTAPPPPQSIEAVRRRARHRLIGAAVLVLVGVLGFPLLFDTQPRPIAVDVPIEIPSRNTPATPAPKTEAPKTEESKKETPKEEEPKSEGNGVSFGKIAGYVAGAAAVGAGGYLAWRRWGAGSSAV